MTMYISREFAEKYKGKLHEINNQRQTGGHFVVEHFDKFGKLLNTYYLRNNVTVQGKNKLLDVMFHGVTPVSPWYVGIIDNVGWTAELSGDTLASHTGWTEFTGYSGNRQEWTEDAAATQSITNSSVVTFAINTSGVLKGIFIASAASGTSGTLWATADFLSNVSVSNGDTLRITYTINT